MPVGYPSTGKPLHRTVRELVDAVNAGGGGGGSYSDENAQDAIAALIAAGSHVGITFTYDDAANALSAAVTGGASATAPRGPAPDWNSYKGWTYDPLLVAANTVLTAGVIYAGRLFLRAGTVTNLHCSIATLGSGLTTGQNLMALVDEDGTQRGVTNDLTATWGSLGVKVCPLATPYVVPADGFYYVHAIGNGTTPPALSRAGSSGVPNAGCPATKPRSATYGTGQTAMPASVTPGSYQHTNTGLWFAAS